MRALPPPNSQFAVHHRWWCCPLPYLSGCWHNFCESWTVKQPSSFFLQSSIICMLLTECQAWIRASRNAKWTRTNTGTVSPRSKIRSLREFLTQESKWLSSVEETDQALKMAALLGSSRGIWTWGCHFATETDSCCCFILKPCFRCRVTVFKKCFKVTFFNKSVSSVVLEWFFKSPSLGPLWPAPVTSLHARVPPARLNTRLHPVSLAVFCIPPSWLYSFFIFYFISWNIFCLAMCVCPVTLHAMSSPWEVSPLTHLVSCSVDFSYQSPYLCYFVSD